MGFLDNVTGGLEDAANVLGLTSPSSSGIDAETEAARQWRAKLMEQYGQASAPTAYVNAPVINAPGYVPGAVGSMPTTAVPVSAVPETMPGQGIGQPEAQQPTGPVSLRSRPYVQKVDTTNAGAQQGSVFTGSGSFTPQMIALPQNIDAAQIGATERYVAPQINNAQEQQARSYQLGLIQQMQRQLNGEAPSVAEMQLKRSQDELAAQQMGAAATARGATGALALRNAQRNIAAGTQANALNAAMLRASEAGQVRSDLANTLSGVRSTDVSTATTQAQLLADASKTNAQREAERAAENARLLQQTREGNVTRALDVAGKNVGAANALGLEGAKMGFEAAQTNAQNRLTAEQMKRNEQGDILGSIGQNFGTTLGGESAGYSADKENQDRKARIAGSALQTIGGMVASDPRAKKDIRGLSSAFKASTSGQDDLDQFISALSAKEFAMKDPEKEGQPPGDQAGILTTDLKKTKLGRALVQTRPDGVEAVDTGRAALVALASIAKLRDAIAQKGGSR